MRSQSANLNVIHSVTTTGLFQTRRDSRGVALIAVAKD
jgi:hypothetical protein